MPIIDFFFLSIVLVTAVLGFTRGFLKEFLGLFNWFASFWVATKFSPVLSGYMKNMSGTGDLKMLISFVILFILTYFILRLFTSFIARAVKLAGLSLPDKFLGSIFGTIKGAVIVVIIAMVMSLVPAWKDKWLSSSEVLPTAKELVNKMKEMVPEDIKKAL